MSGGDQTDMVGCRAEAERLRERCRKLEERLLHQTELEHELRILSWVVQQSSEGIAVADMDGIMIYVNRAWALMHGIPDPRSLIGVHLKVFHNAEQLAHDVEPFNALVKEHGAHSGEVGHVRTDGVTFPTRMTTTLLHNESGEPFAMAALALDITAAKRAEEELRTQRDRAQLYLETASVMLLALGVDGTVQLINRKGCELLGLPEEKILGRSWFDQFVPYRLRDEVRDVFARAVRGELEMAEHFENPVLTADGRERQIVWHNTVLRSPAGTITGTFSSGTDVTEQKRLEEQLLQARKLEALGQLAGGVAHDFNNILQAIFAHLGFAASHVEWEHPVMAELEELRRSARRAGQLTQQLLAFGRQQQLQPKDLDLNELVVRIMKMLQRLIGENIEITLETADQLPTVHVDPVQMEMALLNLCLNARDAMPRGGRLVIRTEKALLPAAIGPVDRDSSGEAVALSVTDTGVGMDEETRERAFEPFFSTKEAGKGTGLGLSTVYGIVAQHDGVVEVESSPGRGTTVRILLPGVDRPVADSGPVSIDLQQGGIETILVAEDDEAIRTVTARTLEEAGYTVLCAADGEEALALFAEHADEIALALLDVVMPKLGGRGVHDRIRAERPRLPILFSTGYSSDPLSADGELPKGTNLIQKPYPAGELLSTIRALIDAE